MNPEAPRTPLWLPPLSLVVIAVSVWVISLSPWRIEPFRVTGQALLLIIVLRAFCYWPPMVRWVGSMPIPHRAMLAFILGGMVLGHYTLNGRVYFPYVSWFIFPSVREVDPVTCREFIATTDDGTKVRLIAEQLFPSIVQIDPVFALDDPRWYPPGTTEKLARTLAKTYNEHHPDNPVWRVDLMELAVQLHPPPGEMRTQPSCELLKRYDISSGQ